ncbi:hypothetical protein V1477_018277 [Vespula maculifrons]|uniref:Uncharacterized protein n=1 Tax=Vespula maculifrons TaxID=7453 RepID=A0ABD2AYZ8_VESMC
MHLTALEALRHSSPRLCPANLPPLFRSKWLAAADGIGNVDSDGGGSGDGDGGGGDGGGGGVAGKAPLSERRQHISNFEEIANSWKQQGN